LGRKPRKVEREDKRYVPKGRTNVEEKGRAFSAVHKHFLMKGSAESRYGRKIAQMKEGKRGKQSRSEEGGVDNEGNFAGGEACVGLWGGLAAGSI